MDNKAAKGPVETIKDPIEKKVFSNVLIFEKRNKELYSLIFSMMVYHLEFGFVVKFLHYWYERKKRTTNTNGLIPRDVMIFQKKKKKELCNLICI